MIVEYTWDDAYYAQKIMYEKIEYLSLQIHALNARLGELESFVGKYQPPRVISTNTTNDFPYTAAEVHYEGA